MKRFALFAALSLLAAACGPAPEPAAAPRAAGDAAIPIGALETPPVHSLIGHRQALGLNSEQITALDSIGQHINMVNRPVMQRLNEIRSQFRGRMGRDARQGEMVPASEEGRAIMEQIRQNNREAVEGVQAVLTPEQQQRTCALFQDADRRRQQRVETRNAPPTSAQARGRAVDAGASSVWPWCGTRTEPAPTT